MAGKPRGTVQIGSIPVGAAAFGMDFVGSSCTGLAFGFLEIRPWRIFVFRLAALGFRELGFWKVGVIICALQDCSALETNRVDITSSARCCRCRCRCR